ncbi:hypothetical protein [Arthrobacter sp. B2a2-09]|uniref:hypothetical protein n=1 Tax=Arthrobacter sp. B2a2-09 TaxID=2952822 RepID=UPI0022CD8BD5|nr:hypothetical protein [Arthrobacter sp. B2a2-09]MCZ9884165.1 hypothetical protein [Arthrobacter sp. B2a2-09]
MKDSKGTRLDSFEAVGKQQVARPASQYSFLIPGKQPATSGSARDASGKGGDAQPPTSTYGPSQMWANRGYLTTGAGTGLGVCVSNGKTAVDLATQSVILAFVINAGLPGGSIGIMGNGDTTGNKGFYISGRPTSGVLRPVINTSTAVYNTLPDGTVTVLDGTDHAVLVAIDAPTKSIFVYVDGVLADTYLNAFNGNTAGATGSFNIGAFGGPLVNAATCAAKFNGIHHMVLTGGLPINVGRLAQLHAERPTRPFTAADIYPTNKRALVVAGAPGQSNELGSGVWLSQTPTNGCPLRDPVLPNGGTSRSMWPHFSEKMGQLGVWTEVINSGVGSTSAAKSWTGQILTWTNGMVVTRGSYVLSSGSLWRCNLAAGLASASTNAPTGAADVTGADAVPWVYLGAPLGYEVNGYVLKDGDTHFDPNGYFAAASAAAAARTGTYADKWVLISIGQGDKTVGTVRADYKQALINSTNYWLARGFKVAIGFTCYGATAGLDAWYTSDLLPGLADAIAFFNGNANVVTGANLRTALGVLPTTPAQGVPGIKSDLLHMNDEALALASEAWASALVAAGWTA